MIATRTADYKWENGDVPESVAGFNIENEADSYKYDGDNKTDGSGWPSSQLLRW